MQKILDETPIRKRQSRGFTLQGLRQSGSPLAKFLVLCRSMEQRYGGYGGRFLIIF
jgi:hypothetical protein